MKIVLTGFEPFGGDSINPSWEAVSRLPSEIDGNAIIQIQLPVEYHKVRTLISELLDREKPDAVICVGQAGGRAMITPEMVAINWMDASIADAANYLAKGELILPEGETAFFSTLPVKAFVTILQSKGIPAALSFTAGTYVCNSTMYHLLDLLKKKNMKIPAGFVHVPLICEQTVGRASSTPSLPLETITKGLEEMIRYLGKDEKCDTAIPLGYTC